MLRHPTDFQGKPFDKARRKPYKDNSWNEQAFDQPKSSFIAVKHGLPAAQYQSWIETEFPNAFGWANGLPAQVAGKPRKTRPGPGEGDELLSRQEEQSTIGSQLKHEDEEDQEDNENMESMENDVLKPAKRLRRS